MTDNFALVFDEIGQLPILQEPGGRNTLGIQCEIDERRLPTTRDWLAPNGDLLSAIFWSGVDHRLDLQFAVWNCCQLDGWRDN